MNKQLNTDTSLDKYWIGYIWADGCLSKRGELRLVSVDNEVIIEFAKFTKNKGRFRVIEECTDKRGYTNSELYEFTLTDKELINNFINLGLHPNKTHTIKPPIQLEKDDEFWRGYIEGNGYIGLDKKNRCNLELSSGSKILCDNFLSFVKTQLPLFKGNVTKENNKNAWRVRLCGKYAKELIKILYNDKPCILKRKYDKALRCINSKGFREIKEKVKCTYCGLSNTVKNGKDNKQQQRYLCRDCKKRFTLI